MEFSPLKPLKCNWQIYRRKIIWHQPKECHEIFQGNLPQIYHTFAFDFPKMGPIYSFSHNHRSVETGYIWKLIFYWREPFLTSMMMGGVYRKIFILTQNVPSVTTVQYSWFVASPNLWIFLDSSRNGASATKWARFKPEFFPRGPITPFIPIVRAHLAAVFFKREKRQKLVAVNINHVFGRKNKSKHMASLHAEQKKRDLRLAIWESQASCGFFYFCYTVLIIKYSSFLGG